MIKDFENKKLSPNKKVTKNGKSAIIETKSKYCFPDYGVVVNASSPCEAEEKLKKIIK